MMAMQYLKLQEEALRHTLGLERLDQQGEKAIALGLLTLAAAVREKEVDTDALAKAIDGGLTFVGDAIERLP